MGYILFAAFLGLAGALFVTKATAGLGLIGLACLLGIFARLRQADQHHQEVRQWMDKLLHRLAMLRQ